MDNTIEEIQKCLTWYDNHKEFNIELLIKCRKKLSILSFRLGEILSNFNRDYGRAYFMRKVVLNKAQLGYINKKNMPVNKAEKMALADSEETLENETNASADMGKAQILLNQTNKIIEVLGQEISYLKQEKQNSND